tara:strand:- start:1753 stop:2517 length:765 start_codon:yes stop_codon:yes gene_type:complete
MPARKKVVAEPKTAKKKDTYVYRLNHGGGMVSIIPSKGVTIYDEERNEVREIRYAPNQKSIYVDEQVGQITREPLKFFQGVLAVPSTKPNLIAFMEAHPDNSQNGGSKFSLVDTERDNEVEMEKEFLANDAITMVKEKTAEELEPVGMHFGIKNTGSIADFKYSLLKIAKSYPSKFMASFDDPVVKVKAKINRASDFGVITLKDSGAYWSDGDSLIVATPTGYSSLNTLAQHCLTDKGSMTYAKIESELDKINK